MNEKVNSLDPDLMAGTWWLIWIYTVHTLSDEGISME
jgi:hypothetical protein